MFAVHNYFKSFVDRIDETTRLKGALSRENPSFVVVYGRRRLYPKRCRQYHIAG